MKFYYSYTLHIFKFQIFSIKNSVLSRKKTATLASYFFIKNNGNYTAWRVEKSIRVKGYGIMVW